MASAEITTLQLQQIAQGDKAAFAQLLASQLPPVIAFIKRYIKEHAQAEDIAQETFIRVWQHAQQWQQRDTSPRSWIFRIAYHLCIDVLRRQKLTTDETETLVELQSVEETVIANNQQQHLRIAMASLPERQRTALYLCAYQGLSNKEAAAILNIGVDALESLLARARRSLRDYFSKLEGEYHESKSSVSR